MIKKELEKDPELAKESWDRFLPNFKKRTQSKRRVPHNVTDKTKKTYTPFPPAQEKSKVDLQIEWRVLLEQAGKGAQSERRQGHKDEGEDGGKAERTIERIRSAGRRRREKEEEAKAGGGRGEGKKKKKKSKDVEANGDAE